MHPRLSVVTGIAAATLALASLASAQATVAKLQIRPIASVNGKDVYQAYCAACHGDDLKGNGPMAAGLKVPPPDLTTIAVRNGGKYSPGYVEEEINGWKRVPRTMDEFSKTQHAMQSGQVEQYGDYVRAMPAFGPIFAKLYPQESTDRRVRMTNLVSYIKSKQVKEAPPPAAAPQ